MSQDQSIPRRNKVDWHMANDDPILTTMRFIPHHEVVQRYDVILPDYLTNPAMKESEAYKTYHDLATGKQISWKSSEEEDNDEENFSTHDDEAKQDKEVNEEYSFDPRVQTPSHVESTDDEDNDDVIQDANVKGDMINDEDTHE
ncbi:hypothetical protein Tco_1412503, partial [Tanacetum coccineum]